MLPARVSAVTIGYLNLDRMLRFYEDLGWTSELHGGEFARFSTGGAMFCLYPSASLGREAGGQDHPADSGYRGVTFAVNVENRDEVDAGISAVRNAGGTVIAEPEDRDWGGRSGYFADPEGNAWEIAWVPGSSFDERGALIWPDAPPQ